MLQFRFAAESDVGRVREHNEDAGFAGPYLLCVADGVGGAAAGEVAAATATYVLSARALAHPGHDPVRLLRAATAEAHQQLVDGVAADDRRTGMATTLTAVLTDGVHTAIAHIGDSRAYLLREGQLSRISRDHTVVQEMLDSGRITEEQAAASPYRHVVLRALDATSTPEPDVLPIALRSGDRLLLCSDGLSDALPDSALGMILTVASRRLATGNLVQAALEAGSRDNVTAIVADVVDEEAVVGTGQVVGAAVDMTRNVVDPTGVRPLRSA